MTDITAAAASPPLLYLLLACDLLRQVIIPFPIGFIISTDKFIIASVVDLEIKLKWGVWPLITQPNAKKQSNFFLFLDIVTGISKIPGV